MEKSSKRFLSVLLALCLMASLLAMPTGVMAASEETSAPAVQSGAYEATASIVEGVAYGDLDGSKSVDPVDAMMVLQAYVGMEELDETQKIAADVDLSESIDPTDAMLILQLYVGDVTELPVIPQEPLPIEDSLVVEDMYDDIRYYTGDKIKTAQTLYMVNAGGLSTEEANLLMSLQGIVAKKEAQIFLYYEYMEVWKQEMEKYYDIEFIEVDDYWDLVDMFKDELQDNGYVRYVQYDPDNPIQTDEEATSINVASTIAGQERYLIVEDSLKAQAEQHGLVQKMDATLYDQYTIFWGDSSLDFEGYRKSVDKNIIISLAWDQRNGRDLGIALGCYFWRDLDTDIMDLVDAMAELNDNGLVLGWHNDELTGVSYSSHQSWATVPDNHSNNNTIFTGLPSSNFNQIPTNTYEVLDSDDVHYVTYIMSDGDNIMWLKLNFVDNKDYYGAESRGTIPFGWSMSPSLVEFGPTVTNYLYSNATVNDYFVTSFSGLGYMCTDIYGDNEGMHEELLDEYYKRTTEYMKAVDSNYVCIMEWNKDLDSSSGGEQKRSNLLKTYAKYDQIKGGFLFFDSSTNHGLYIHDMPRAGGIYFENDKPFVLMRESLCINTSSGEEVTTAKQIQQYSEMAYRINNYKTDATTIEGYTAINVHPWSFSYDDCVNMTTLFDDDVVVVTPNEFMQLITKKVDHTTKLVLDDVTNFDYTNIEKYQDVTELDYKRAALKPATDRTSFDFEDSTQGWVSIIGQEKLDQACYSTYDGEKGLNLVGSHFAPDILIPNASYYNKINVPEDATTFTIQFKPANSAYIRIQTLSEDGTVTTVRDWEKAESQTSMSCDISEFAGETTTFYIQFSEGSAGGGGLLVYAVDIA